MLYVPIFGIRKFNNKTKQITKNRSSGNYIYKNKEKMYVFVV